MSRLNKRIRRRRCSNKKQVVIRPSVKPKLDPKLIERHIMRQLLRLEIHKTIRLIDDLSKNRTLH